MAVVGLAAAVGLALQGRAAAPSAKPVELVVTIAEPAEGASVVQGEPVVVRGRVELPAGERWRPSVSVNEVAASVDATGAFKATVRLETDRVVATAVDVSSERHGRAQRSVVLALVPAWFRALPIEERPALPLPVDVVFGPGDGEYVNERDGSVLVFASGGSFPMGSEERSEPEFANERPVHVVQVDPFFFGKYEITNAQFGAFVAATGHQTEAERHGASLVIQPVGDLGGGAFTLAGVMTKGASWRTPEPGASADPRHPVVHVSWRDAKRYAQWAGLELPSEAQWERAARWDSRGRRARRYAWGDEGPDGKKAFANTVDVSALRKWRVQIPKGTSDDGYARTSPVGAFVADCSSVGAMDLGGNVAEWCEDAYDPKAYELLRLARNPVIETASARERVRRGGAWYLEDSYARAAMRGWEEPATAIDAVGIRLQRSVSGKSRGR